MQDYKDDLMYAREEAAEEVADRRYQRIVEEMEKLGWNTVLYSPERGEEDFSKWQEYLFQPKEFTARSTSIPPSSRIAVHIFYLNAGWRNLQPKLAAIYHHTRRSRLIDALLRRAGGQYLEFREAQTPEVRRTLPPWADVKAHGFLHDFGSRNYEECSEEEMAGADSADCQRVPGVRIAGRA